MGSKAAARGFVSVPGHMLRLLLAHAVARSLQPMTAGGEDAGAYVLNLERVPPAQI